MRFIDLNCDLGEGAGHDAELMPLITSANIACGGHAGDGPTMRTAVELALQHGVAIGAHPGLNDREHFGRREAPIAPTEARALVLAQIRALQLIMQPCGGRLVHVKPHGALYNMAGRDAALARAVAEAVREVDPRLVLFGLAGSQLLPAGCACGLRVASEVFADRTYQPDGSLTNKTLFCKLGSDGMTIDDEGNLYLTGRGVTIFDKNGTQTGHIDVNEKWTANVSFGGKDHKTLFITASESLYSIQLRVKGANPSK